MLMMMGGNSALSRRGISSYVPPPAPLSIPAYWGWYGDSHTAGREPEVTANKPQTCFKIMWDASYTPATIDTHYLNGQSGRSLANTLLRCLGRTHAGTPWIHMQESGDQNNDGQRTASEFGATFQQGWEDVYALWPDGFFSYETAHSFSPARKAQPYRNWDTYNVELRSRIETLAGLGITVHLVETEYYIDLAIAEFGYDTVCFPDAHADAYHFQGLGNFAIALAQFKAYNYNVTALDHSGINLNSTQKATAVAIVAGN